LTDKFAGARATVTFLTNMNLFAGQPKQFLAELQRLADAADAARRQG
jgi:hypothetical protein